MVSGGLVAGLVQPLIIIVIIPTNNQYRILFLLRDFNSESFERFVDAGG